MKKTGLIILLVLALSLVGCSIQLPEINPMQGEESEFITISTSDEKLQELNGETIEIEVKWQHIALSSSDAERFPLLNKRFEELNKEKDAYALETKADFLDMMAEFPVEENAWYYHSNLEYKIQRTDKYIVSLISDFENYSGGAHGYYSQLGINIDPETGENVSFENVICDRDAFDKIVYDALLETNPYEIREENRQGFYDTYKEQGYNWSMDYDKLTVYFNPYEIASYAAGLIKVDVKFGEYPELFNEKYTKVPENLPAESGMNSHN